MYSTVKNFDLCDASKIIIVNNFCALMLQAKKVYRVKLMAYYFNEFVNFYPVPV